MGYTAFDSAGLLFAVLRQQSRPCARTGILAHCRVVWSSFQEAVDQTQNEALHKEYVLSSDPDILDSATSAASDEMSHDASRHARESG